jgi:hypothetical protein
VTVHAGVGLEAPGYVHAFGDIFAIRVNNQGIDHCKHQQPLIISIYVAQAWSANSSSRPLPPPRAVAPVHDQISNPASQAV